MDKVWSEEKDFKVAISGTKSIQKDLYTYAAYLENKTKLRAVAYYQ